MTQVPDGAVSVSPDQMDYMLRRMVDRFLTKDGNEIMQFHANVHIVLTGDDGTVKADFWHHNLIVTAGRREFLKASSASYLNQFAYIAIGTGATAAVIGDTTLGTEVARSTVITPTNPNADTLQFVFSFAAGVGTGTITEYGLLNAASVGVLLSRLVSGTITKAAGDTLQVTYQLT